ncbi:MAG: NusG domain II-containing protein, partial [Lachnospiraceae bacterium]|nr:NusG domain II-containing protein [Lachnospiraceae bacterium]
MSERKKHVIGFIILIGICVLALLFMTLRPKATGSYCEILVQGEVVDTLPLSEDVTKRIDTSEGYNVIRIQDGSVYVSEADCQNQIC